MAIPTIRDLKKRILYRIPIWCFMLCVTLLIDEYVKEGYLFSISDIVYPMTHEFLITTLIAIGLTDIAYLLYKRSRPKS